MKKTIEQIRIEKGFETAGEFANYIGMAGPNYSQVATGKKPVTQNMIMKLKKRFPDDDFDDILIKNDTENLRYYTESPVYEFRDQMEFYSDSNWRHIPVMKKTDRPKLPELLSGNMRHIELVRILHDNLQNIRADYFVLEASEEAHVDFIRPGDRLMCYEVKKHDWWRISLGSVVLIYSSVVCDIIIRVGKNLLSFGSDNASIGSDEDPVYISNNIKHIYQVDGLYRKL